MGRTIKTLAPASMAASVLPIRLSRPALPVHASSMYGMSLCSRQCFIWFYLSAG
jgi:hypothetical protein